MKILEELLGAAKEIERLQSTEKQLTEAIAMIAQMELQTAASTEILNSIIREIIPEEYLKLEEHAVRCSKMWNYLAVAKEFLERPKAVGYTILCTYDDPGADSSGNNSMYGLFLLLSDGRVMPVAKLGLYEGDTLGRIPSSIEMLVRMCPFIGHQDIAKKAPQCLEEARKASDRDIAI